MQLRKRILLIDNNPDISLSTVLQENGSKLITCESPNKAWDLFFLYRPHLIIVHLHHPSKGEKATLQECRVLAKGVPVIVAMSIDGNEAVTQTLEAGATSFLPLPVRPEILRKFLGN